MRIAIGCDHGGFELKRALLDWLTREGEDVTDCGCPSTDRVDYPLYAHAVCREIQEGRADIGILVCKTGEGMTMVANKHRGIRAALVYNLDVASLAREHNDANVICFGASFMGLDQAEACVKKFLETGFAGGRHTARVDMMEKWEA